MQIPILHGTGRFYVYEHLRPTTGEVFYVGKGSGHRARVASRHHRNAHWQRIVAKDGGFSVRMVAHGIDEELALLAEIERIDQLRRLGVPLCNQTDGGDGVAGWVKTPEWRAKVGAAHRGKVLSEETRRKISEAVKAAGYVHSPEALLRISEANRGHRRNVGRVQHQEERDKRAVSLRGNRSRLGQKRSAEERAKSSAVLRGRVQTKIECPHCQAVGGNVMRRWHFDDCKRRAAP